MDAQSLEEVFSHIDVDNSGFLDAEELIKLMQDADLDVSLDEVKAMIKMADTNGDGVIDLKEFKQLMGNL
ncbi:EF-hand domain-containing protein [Prochlorothrix hollandica]|uniref:EF-hand domain-containing protein n=1 Tax=Prochlorothrix hollandica PCC 9006 = CALU 1027 TaxID=317619 RepID=A0A0M2Q4E0_PROHO|nr:EF-hand domain-containing protein [Prochlorothrix hollandica]KKJ01442.1 hypothetical protein PROH_03670 [Prochlorothrix hollandica PCC 9006 = CALU 1027]